MSSAQDSESEARALTQGCADYIKKPYCDIIVRARVNTQLQSAAQRKKIEQLSMIDPLTGIPNRRCFDIRIDLAWAHSVREHLPISLLMLDIDFFKKYNDTYGHPQGDTLLRSFAEVISKEAKRAADTCARIGGEEFAVLLPCTNLSGAVVAAERIRAAIENMIVPTQSGELTSVSVSIGVASMSPVYGDNQKSLMDEADARLYHAKAAGRNRVSYDTRV